jgi:uncharacterized surface protein with fasciclin (FAS1) repeats
MESCGTYATVHVRECTDGHSEIDVVASQCFFIFLLKALVGLQTAVPRLLGALYLESQHRHHIHFSIMYLSILAAATFFSAEALANSLNTELENVAEFQSWYSLIKPYKDVIINLHQNDQVTILIPSPDAVTEFESSDRFTEDSESIRQLLLYHVIKGEHKSKDIVAAGPFLETYLQQDGLSGGQKVQVARGVQTKTNELEQIVFYSGMGQNSSLSSNAYGRVCPQYFLCSCKTPKYEAAEVLTAQSDLR